MLFWINCVFNYITDSCPFNFCFVIFICNGLICMRKWKIDKISLVLLKLFKYLRVIDRLNFYSLPIFIFLVSPVLWKWNDFLKKLFGHWVSMSKLIVHDWVVITTIRRRILATEHVHFKFYTENGWLFLNYQLKNN